MEKKLIICCGAGRWTKFIGWIEAILSGIFGGWELFQLYSFALASLVIYRKGEMRMEDVFGEFWGALLGILIANISFSLVQLTIALILLRGAYTKNPRHLKTWLRYTLISYIIWVIFKLILLGFELTVFMAAITFIWIAVGAAIMGFLYWVVATYKEELETFGVCRTPSS